MRIAFHILRMNWYRLMAAVIDEALKCGHHVECWHNAGAKGLADNTPVLEKVPEFKYGTPKIIEYYSQGEFIQYLQEGQVDVCMDIMPLGRSFSALPKDLNCYFVLLGTDGDCPNCIEDYAQMRSCDLIVTETDWRLNVACEMMTQDNELIINKAMESLDGFSRRTSKIFIGQIKKYLLWQWSDRDVDYFKRHSVVTGIPSLDILHCINKEDVKKKYGIPDDKKIVVLLISPFDMSLGFFFAELYMKNNWLSRLITLLSYRELSKVKCIFDKGYDKLVIKGIRRFCDNNNAYLIAKARHSRKVKDYVQRSADIIVADNNFYPHTALEFFSIADLTIGFYTTGVLEAVAAGSPYLNIDIPFFPKDFWFDYLSPNQEYIRNYKGVVRSINAVDIVEDFYQYKLRDFSYNEKDRDLYMRKYAGPADSKSSERLMKAIEYLVDHGHVPAIEH